MFLYEKKKKNFDFYFLIIFFLFFIKVVSNFFKNHTLTNVLRVFVNWINFLSFNQEFYLKLILWCKSIRQFSIYWFSPVSKSWCMQDLTQDIGKLTQAYTKTSSL